MDKNRKLSSYTHSEWGEGLMREWIDERCYQVGDAGTAIAGDEPDEPEGDGEDGRWRGFWGSFMILALEVFGIFVWLQY